MPRRALLFTPAILLAVTVLSACGKGGSGSAGSSGNAVGGGSAEVSLNPGQWQSTLKLERFEMGGNVPPEVKGMMQKTMGAERSFASCLTPEEAKAPKAGFFNRESGCTYDKFLVVGGHIEGKATCRREGMTQTMAMSGQYGGDSYTMHVETDTKMPGGMPMSMAMTINARRTGDCTGKESG